MSAAERNGHDGTRVGNGFDHAWLQSDLVGPAAKTICAFSTMSVCLTSQARTDAVLTSGFGFEATGFAKNCANILAVIPKHPGSTVVAEKYH